MEIYQQKPGSTGITVYWRASRDWTGRPMDGRNNFHQRTPRSYNPILYVKTAEETVGDQSSTVCSGGKTIT